VAAAIAAIDEAAWAVIASLAHNLLRWTCALGLKLPGLLGAKTVRRRRRAFLEEHPMGRCVTG
jgi:hypothetical protein